MPVLDGVSATKLILQTQKEENTYKLPIVALTANSIEGDKERYLYAGMDDYMAKPIQEDELRAMIHKYTTLTENKTNKNCCTPLSDRFIRSVPDSRISTAIVGSKMLSLPPSPSNRRT